MSAHSTDTSRDSTDMASLISHRAILVHPGTRRNVVPHCTKNFGWSRASGTMQTMASATRTYGGVTAGQRRATRRAALIEAALDLFAEEGARAVSKRAVCARARLNDRYFYEHFTDSDALLEAIARDLTAEGLEAVNAATRRAAPDIHTQVQATAEAALEFLTADPGAASYFYAPTHPRFCSAPAWTAPTRFLRPCPR